MLLASKKAVEENNLVPLAKLKRVDFAGLEPERMGMGPLVAIDKVFKKTGMEISDFDLVEINEAFAAQVIAVQRALDDSAQAKRFGVDKAWGAVPKIN